MNVDGVQILQGTIEEFAKAQELVCPDKACHGAELREIKTERISAGQCPLCKVVYVWRWQG